jgi:pyrimidine operon attenuation protein/uracil phosphoribosyltransferase
VAFEVFFPRPFLTDSRGNKLEKYEVKVVRGTNKHRIYLLGSNAIAKQVEEILWAQWCMPLQLTDEQRRTWTHRLAIDGPCSDTTFEILDLLKTVVTLEVPEEIDTALAVDFYKDPNSHEDPQRWSNTRAGQLVHRGKYWVQEEAQEYALRSLARLMLDIIDKHPLYASAEVVVSVPGHDASVVGFGEKLAMKVAAKSGKILTKTDARSSNRPPAKNLNSGQAQDLTNEFSLSEDVAGRTIIIVDDVYRSGTTMRAVASAARRAGADQVLGLVGARTMRS